LLQNWGRCHAASSHQDLHFHQAAERVFVPNDGYAVDLRHASNTRLVHVFE
jgi:hypothetical protein